MNENHHFENEEEIEVSFEKYEVSRYKLDLDVLISSHCSRGTYSLSEAHWQSIGYRNFDQVEIELRSRCNQ